MFKGVHRAMMDVSSDSPLALANIRAMRRESMLSHLPPAYKTPSKVTLRQSSVLSSFLFDEDKVKDAMQLAAKSASITFQQAATRALVNQCRLLVRF